MKSAFKKIKVFVLEMADWPSSVLQELQRMNKNLEAIQKDSSKLSGCVDNTNHRNKNSITTAHLDD